MIGYDITFPSPEDNILFDEVLLAEAERGRAHRMILRFWEPAGVFVVLGRISKAEEDLFVGRLAADRVPVLRRASGGGTVLQGPGCLNFTLVLPKAADPALNDIKRSYRYILDKLLPLGTAAGRQARFFPICDLAVGPPWRKFSGNAQKRGRDFIMHHGTVLYAFDLPLISHYLKLPVKEPEYRKGRGHESFVTNLALDAPTIKRVIMDAFGIRQIRDVPAALLADLERFRQEKNVVIGNVK